MASQHTRKTPWVQGVSLRRPPIFVMSPEPLMACMTEPAHRNRPALKKAWVNRWKTPRAKFAGADAREHEAQLADRRVGQHLLEVVLGEPDDGREQRGDRADQGHDGHGRRRQQVEGVHARHHVDAGRHHGGGVDQRRDRRGAGHGVGQPDVKRDLRRLAGGADEQEQRRPRTPPACPSQQRRHQRAEPGRAGRGDRRWKLRVPVAWNSRNMPIRKPKSPMRLVMKAFLPASALAVVWYQKPISR